MDRVEQGGEMSVLCHGNCHVTINDEPACMCGAVASQPYPLSGGVIPGYTPNGFAPPRPPTAGAAPPIGVAQFRAAKAIEDATHLSSDGQQVFIQRLGNMRVCFWDEETKQFQSSFPCPNGLPPDAVEM